MANLIALVFLLANPGWAGALRDAIPFQESSDDVATEVLQVAIDPRRPRSPERLTISYQILSASQTDRPILILIGGGPGMSSMDRYFKDQDERSGLTGYAKYFRIVVFDQRGVGKSSPIDANSQALSAELGMRYFGAPAHAFDVAQLVSKLVLPGEPFFLMGHSYGGTVIEIMSAIRISPNPPVYFLSAHFPSRWRLTTSSYSESKVKLNSITACCPLGRVNRFGRYAGRFRIAKSPWQAVIAFYLTN